MMRLSDYPFVVVRVACSRCSRQGRYRLARLADRYGSEIGLPMLLGYLAGDCKLRDANKHVYDFCGAFFPDTAGPAPPDLPAELKRPKLL